MEKEIYIKNVIKTIWIIILMVIISFSFNTCKEEEDGSGELVNIIESTVGRLTIYGLENYEGKYVSASDNMNHLGRSELIAYDNLTMYSGGPWHFTRGKIVNGSVTLKVWIRDLSKPGQMRNYNVTEERTAVLWINIYNDKTLTGQAYATGVGNGNIIGYNITYTNGKGSCLWAYNSGEQY